MTVLIRSQKIDLIPIGEIKLNPGNTNTHPRDQIEQLKEIIIYQGFRSPCTISNRTGLLIAGEGRYIAAKELGMPEIPVMFQDFDDENQEIAACTSDNAIQAWAILDYVKVQNQLKLMRDFDAKLFGIKDFKLPEIEVLPPGCDEDEVPDAPLEPLSRPGDVYILGNHRLMCGDSTSIDAVEKLMNGEKADMVFTDPPYGISYQSNMRTKSAKFDIIENDETFLSEWINVLPIMSKGWVFVWTTWKVLDKWLEITSSIGELSNVIIWDKGGGGIGDLQKTFSTDYEMALVFNRGAHITGKRLGSVWSVGKDKSKDYIHPTQKPVELGQLAMENCTIPSSKILDLFGGSGSTLIACEKTNRKCFMMELDPKYCDVIVSRWEKFTGKKAELIDGQAS